MLKSENTDESQICPLILLQSFLRLAYTNLYSKKETIFEASKKRLVRLINLSVQTDFLKKFIKADLKTGGKQTVIYV